MSEKRMLVVDADLVRKIDENRGELSRSEFIDLLIEGQLLEKGENGKQPGKREDVVTREEFVQFQEGAKELLRSFLTSSSTTASNWGVNPVTRSSNSSATSCGTLLVHTATSYTIA